MGILYYCMPSRPDLMMMNNITDDKISQLLLHFNNNMLFYRSIAINASPSSPALCYLIIFGSVGPLYVTVRCHHSEWISGKQLLETKTTRMGSVDMGRIDVTSVCENLRGYHH